MKKRLLISFILLLLGFVLWGVGKLYIAYNLSRYAGYYVQHMPRKKGTNPEIAILLENLDTIERPEYNGISYDLDGNGAILKNNQIILSYGTIFRLRVLSNDKIYIFDKEKASFQYYITSKDYDDEKEGKKYQQEAESYLKELLPPVLKAQPKPKINLQKLFNEKYQARFN